MKTIIAGSREIAQKQGVFMLLDSFGPPYTIRTIPWRISEVVCGMARGVDLLGKEWAEGKNIPVREFPADWDTYGKKAGYLRNEQMAKYANGLIAIWDGQSKGTKHMIDLALANKLWTVVIIP